MNAPGAAPPTAVGRYAMYGAIGAGGMATVHLGRGPGGDVVAIKRLKPHLVAEPDVVLAFLDEARLSARIRHPNVVSMLDVVTQDHEAFLVMEYVEGVALTSLMRSAPPVAPDLAAAVLVGMLLGLHIVHRDVSPHNVMVGVDGSVRVLDFGVAKALGRQQTTRDGAIKGKLGYMAPEQLSGRGVTRRTDVFAAGIVLWELLTGERLFQADDEATTLTRVLMERVRPPAEVNPATPAALDRIVMRALERDPSKRFLSAEDMAAALAAAVPPAAPASLGAWVRAVAAEELARRAALLQTEPTEAYPSSGATLTEVDAATIAVGSAPRAPTRRARMTGAALVAMALLTWGVVSMSRAPASASAPAPSSTSESAAAAPPPSAAPSASATASAAEATSASTLASAVPPAPPPPAPGHRRSPAPRPTGSARARLYSRD
jgi:serine/threonine-protein kinase